MKDKKNGGKMKKNVLCLVVVLMLGNVIFLQSQQIELIASHPLSASTINRINGFSKQNHYLYISSGNNSIDVFDVNDPENPTITTTLSNRRYFGFEPSGNYGFSSGYIYGLDVYSLSNPAIPSYQSSVNSTSDAMGICKLNNYIYVGKGWYGFCTVDISNQTSPYVTNTHSGGSYHGWNACVAVGSILVSKRDHGLEIYSLVNPAEPSYQSAIELSITTSPDEYMFIINDCIWFMQNQGSNRNIQIYDVQDMSNPSEVEELDFGVDVTSFLIDDSLLYVGLANSQIRTYDITDISNIQLLYTFQGEDGYSYKPMYLEDNIMYASVNDGTGGYFLNIFEISELILTSNFSAFPDSGYVPLEVDFTDTSIGYPTSWEWDFENDGVYDSFIQNPTHIYNTAGLYSVKLKVNDGTSVDSLIQYNYITVEYVPPAEPQNVQVNTVHPDAIISWSAVDTTIFGDPITPDGYIVLYSENEEDYFYLWVTSDTTFTHIGVAEFRDQMFYQVVAYINYSREQIEYLKSLNNSRERVKWAEVKRKLKEIK